MGRSVYVPHKAAEVFYFPFEPSLGEDGKYDEDLARIEWDDLIWSIRQCVELLDDSYTSIDRWYEREGHLIATNKYCDVVLSEYCGLCSLSFIPEEDAPDDVWEKLAKVWEDYSANWISSQRELIAERLRSYGLQLYNLVGRFSNGEAVFETAK